MPDDFVIMGGNERFLDLGEDDNDFLMMEDFGDDEDSEVQNVLGDSVTVEQMDHAIKQLFNNNFPNHNATNPQTKIKKVKNKDQCEHWPSVLKEQETKERQKIEEGVDEEIDETRFNQNLFFQTDDDSTPIPYVVDVSRTNLDEARLKLISKYNLNNDQKFAFNIVCEHVIESVIAEINDKPAPEPLFLLVLGEGGTGKSRIIRSIKKFLIV